jgi:hypothetical protein
MRAAATTATGAGVIPPTWLFDEFAGAAHGGRPTADTLRRVPITNANPITIGVQTAGAVVGDQAAENTAPADGSFTATPLVTVPKTKTGKVDVSRQLLDGSNPAVDGLVFSDCLGAYAENVEMMVWAALEALLPAGMAGEVTVDLATDIIPDGLIDAGVLVRTNRKAPPRVAFCSEVTWGTLTKEKDLAGRPLVVTGYHGPNNAYGLGEAITYGHIAGEVAGLNVVPSWAGTDNHFYTVKADDTLLLESTTMTFRYEEVLGPETIRLGVWGYAAVVLGRYPNAIARLVVTDTSDAGTASARKAAK